MQQGSTRAYSYPLQFCNWYKFVFMQVRHWPLDTQHQSRSSTLAYSSAQCTLHCLPLVETHLKASQDWDYTSTSYVLLFCTAKLKCVISSVCNRGCTIWVPWSDFINDCSSPGGWWHLGYQHHAACLHIIQCGLRRNWIALVNTSEKKLPGIWTLGSFLVAFV